MLTKIKGQQSALLKEDGINENSLSLKKAFNLPLLPEEEFYSLFKSFKNNNDKKAKDKIILSFYKLVCRIASKLKKYSNSYIINPKKIEQKNGGRENELYLDLRNEGVAGICKALDKADKNVSYGQFINYAKTWIRGSMNSFILNNHRIVNGITTAGKRKLFYKLNKTKKEIGIKEKNKKLNVLQVQLIAKKLDVPEEDVEFAEKYMNEKQVSLSDTDQDGTRRNYEKYLDDNAKLYYADKCEKNEESFENKQYINKIKQYLDVLNPREKEIIEKSYLASPNKIKTMSSLAKDFGISRQRVKQIEQSAIKKLKTEMGIQLEEIK